MILLNIHMKVAPAQRKELTQAIGSLLGSIRCVKGCLSCDIYTSLEDQNQLCLCGEWESGEDLAGHLRSEHFKVLLGAMSLLQQPYEVRFYTAAPDSRILEFLSLF
jgi:quinol monooxygenase YgiN